MKFVFDDFESSYDYLHRKVIPIALHLQRLKCKQIAIETYKIIYGNGPVHIKGKWTCIYERFYGSGGKFFVMDAITWLHSKYKFNKICNTQLCLYCSQNLEFITNKNKGPLVI